MSDLLIKNIFNDKITPELAYVVGVFMGDGFITPSGFGLTSIDKEFAEKTRYCLKTFIKTENPNMPIIRKKSGGNREYNEKTYNCKPSYNFILSSTSFRKWLTKITDDKTKIPDFIFDSDESIKKKISFRTDG